MRQLVWPAGGVGYGLAQPVLDQFVDLALHGLEFHGAGDDPKRAQAECVPRSAGKERLQPPNNAIEVVVSVRLVADARAGDFLARPQNVELAPQVQRPLRAA